MKNRSLGNLIVVLTLLLCLSGGCRDKAPQSYTVGILSGTKAFEAVGEAFVRKMGELGYHEGANITYAFSGVYFDQDKLKEAAEKFVADNVDLIVAFPTGAAVAAHKAVQGSEIPVVFTWATIDDNDLAKSIREHSRNITGVVYPPLSDIFMKRFEVLTDLVPSARRILLLNHIGYPTSIGTLKALKKLAPSMNIELAIVPITSLEDIIAALDGKGNYDLGRIDAIYTMPEPITADPENFKILSHYAEKNRIPLGGATDFTARAGALFSYAPLFADAGHLAALLADKILQGVKPNSLPLVTLEGQLRINLKQAQKLGMTVPEGLLKLAVEIIHE
nr:ABC transporter substrate-binding protein [uncultured Desulfobacter sp.]